MSENVVREIKARVEIAYGNEEIADALTYTDDKANPISKFNNLFNNKHIPKVSAFTLEGNALSEERGLVDPDVVGWWSESFSGASESADGGYSFNDHPKLTIKLGSERPMRMFQIYGDPMLKEFPVRFKISLFHDGSDTACYEKTFTNHEVEANIDLTEGLAKDGLVNGYIVGISKMTVEIMEWNKPNRLSKIYRCYDDIIERYEQDELKSFECIRELPNTDEIQYGLVSGSCSVTLLNNKDRKFDLGYLKDMAHINKRVVPYINGEKLGSFYIKEWDISQDSMFVKCEASDRLLDFQDLMYEGRMPRADDTDKAWTFKQLFAAVLDSANKHFVKEFKYEIDETLADTKFTLEPYLPRKSIWDVLQMLCDASMSFIYVDKNDVICVKSELVKPDKTDGRSEYNGGLAKVLIDPDNAFGINIPFFADMETNKVEIPYYRKVIKTDQELYRISEYGAHEGEKVSISIELDKFCEIERVEYAGGNYNFSKRTLTVTKIGGSDFKYSISFIVESMDNKKNDLVVYGKEISFEKQNLQAQNENSITKNALSLYTHPDCELIQSEALASEIALRIMTLYPSGTRSVTSSWRGTEKLNLLEAVAVTDRFGGTSEYIVTQIKNSVDGGFRQEIKGIKTKTVAEGKYSIDKIGGT